MRDRRASLVAVLGVLGALVALCGACAESGAGRPGPVVGRAIRVVAAENFWGSIAQQVGGSAVRVDSVITNPAADPHDYEPTPADARAMAGADLVIVNGVGYDPWATTLLAASPGPRVIDVGDLVGAKDGDNPHLWYNPAHVRSFISALTRDLEKLDPAGGFAHGAELYERAGLKRYNDLIAAIRKRYAGTDVGASESIFAMLAPALGLRLVTPPAFLRAVSEGTDVSAADKRAIDRQIASRQIRIYVYNRQNATPDIQAQLAACRAHDIPVAAITETMVPASTTYQAWQSDQLAGIERALRAAHA
jgi:zinc/manganese transport system substrate-binding protein